MTTKEAYTREAVREQIPTANFQFQVEPSKVPWMYAAIKNSPEVLLYDGGFPNPFNSLKYIARSTNDQLVLSAIFGVGDDFSSRFGTTLGSPEDLEPFLKRYPEHKFSPDGRQLAIVKNKEILAVLARVSTNNPENPDQIVIQRGGGAGKINLSEEGSNPVNDLSNQLDIFNILVQRYVSAIWKASPESNHRKKQTILDIPALPEGAAHTYFSTFEIIGKDFKARPRPLDLETDIGGYPDIKAAIKSLFMDMADPETSRAFGTQPFSNKFILVTGEEGTGKSLYPKALDKMLRDHFGEKFEHFRLPLGDIINQHGTLTSDLVTTILDHIRKNEKNGVPTLLHIDNLEQLIPLHKRDSNSDQRGPTSAEFMFNQQVITPTVNALSLFGRDLGGESKHTIIYGESRAPRDELPEGAARTFRRSFQIRTSTQRDLIEILGIQVATTRSYAKGTGRDPFLPNIESQFPYIVTHAIGLNGRDLQQAILNIASRKKAARHGPLNGAITPDEMSEELESIRLAKGIRNEGRRKINLLDLTRKD